MKKIILALILVLAVAGIVLWSKQKKIADSVNNNVATSTQSLSDGVIQFSYPNDFGLAVTQEQLTGMVHSYIPPCSEGFSYCLYYYGQDFSLTNFESAGIRISKRNDLGSERVCLNTPPDGYTGKAPSGTTSKDSYSASIFSKIGDAGAGHYANGELYRIFFRGSNLCYEVETRIGETQFANYPPGTKKEFTEDDRNTIYAKFNSILGGLKIASTTESISLPASED